MPGVGKSDTIPPDNPGPPRFKVPVPDRVANLIAKIRDTPEFTELDGNTFIVTKGPLEIHKDGVAVGYEVWVKHFDANGYEIDIDPHRRFLYPPDGSYLDAQGNRQIHAAPELVARDMISRTVRDTPGRS